MNTNSIKTINIKTKNIKRITLLSYNNDRMRYYSLLRLERNYIHMWISNYSQLNSPFCRRPYFLFASNNFSCKLNNYPFSTIRQLEKEKSISKDVKKKNLFTWFGNNLLKISLIFLIGFTTRLLVNYYFSINVFCDYTHVISILYYFNLSSITLYIKDIDFKMNYSDFKMNYSDYNTRVEITLENIANAITSYIDANKMITSNWEGYSSNIHKIEKGSIMAMNNPGNNQQGTSSGGGNQAAGGPNQVSGGGNKAAGGPNQVAGAPDQVAGVVSVRGFMCSPGQGGYNLYFVSDPNDIAYNGYINPITQRPHTHSFQPFATNLANAMHAHAHQDDRKITSWSGDSFDPVSRRFYLEYMEYHFPNRKINNYNNSTPIRTAIRKLP